MKNLLFILLVCCSFAACDNTEDHWRVVNDKPTLELKGVNTPDYATEIYDSVKLGKNYPLLYKVEDNHETRFNYHFINGEGNLSVNAAINQVNIDISKTGLHEIEFSAIDELEETGSAILQLEVFENLKPVCKWDFSTNSGYSITIDASTSYDRDAKHGGKIVAYRFRIGDFDTEAINLSSINYQFTNAGSYLVEVWTKDNNGQWSDVNAKTITLN